VRRARAAILLTLAGAIACAGCDGGAAPSEPGATSAAGASPPAGIGGAPAAPVAAPVAATLDELVRAAIEPGDDDARAAAVRAIAGRGDDAAGAALAQVVVAAPAGRVLAQAALALVARRRPADTVSAFRQRMERTQDGWPALIQSLATGDAPIVVKEFLLELTASDDVDLARSAAETLFAFTGKGADTFETAFGRVMGRLPRPEVKIDFARRAARTQTLEGAAAVARFAAASDDPADWRAMIDAFSSDVAEEHQRFFRELRAIAVRTTDARMQADVRALVRRRYANDLVLEAGRPPQRFVCVAVWTREDLLDEATVQRPPSPGRAVIWVRGMPAPFEIPAGEGAQDRLMLGADRRVTEIVDWPDQRGAAVPASATFVIVLPPGAARRIRVRVGDAVDFDEVLVRALLEKTE
jgi:hypothetical protein